MNYKNIVRKLLEGISDLLRIKVVRYLIIILLIGMIITFFVSNNKESIQKEISNEKKQNITRYNNQNEILWEVNNTIRKEIYDQIIQINNRTNGLSDTENILKQMFKEYTLNDEIAIENIKLIGDEIYKADVIYYKWVVSSYNGEGTTRKVAFCNIKIKKEDKEVKILEVSSFEQY